MIIHTTESLSNNLVKLLEIEQQPVTALSLAKKLNYESAKFVNPSLYKLEKLGKIVKTDGSMPPTWAIHKVLIHQDKVILCKYPKELQQKILDFIKIQEYPVSTKYIAGNIGDATLSHVNSMLYSLMSEGLVCKLPVSPPLWYFPQIYCKDTLILKIMESLEPIDNVENLLIIRHAIEEQSSKTLS